MVERGQLIEGKYRVERELGRGAMGAVFEATHLLRKARVALKFMSPEALGQADAIDRFLNEAVAASDVPSDHVVRILDVGRFDGQPYLVLELLEGRDLADELTVLEEAGSTMGEARAVHIVLQLLRALDAAHARGIVHRDLKPANVFLTAHDGQEDFVKVLDFGISKRTQGEDVARTASFVTLGTPLYMSPEQARSAKDAEPRSDLYSVGAILYEMLAGRPPHDADNYNMVLYKLFQEEVPPLAARRPGISEGLAVAVHRALARRPEDRFESALAFAHALMPYADERSQLVIERTRGRDSSAARVTPNPSLPKVDTNAATLALVSPVTATTQRRSWLPLAALALAATLGVGSWMAARRAPPPPSGAPTATTTTLTTHAPSTTISASASSSPAKPSPSTVAAPAVSAPPSAPPSTIPIAPKKPLEWELDR